jgi:hypothetical protein
MNKTPLKATLVLLAGAALLAAFAPTATAQDVCVLSGTTCVTTSHGGVCTVSGTGGTQTWTCAGAQGVCTFTWTGGQYNGGNCVFYVDGGSVCVLKNDDGQGHVNYLACV